MKDAKTAPIAAVAQFLGKAAYAKHRGVAPSMVTHWRKGGRIVMDPTGKFVDVAASDQALAGSLDPSRGGKGGKSERKPAAQSPTSSFVEHKARHEDFKARAAELAYLEAARELVPRKDFERAVAACMAPITAAVDSLAPRIARAVVGETDVRKIEAAIEKEATDIRADLVKALATLLSEPTESRQ